MGVYQGNFPPQLGGVSQQVYTDRQVGQVEEQVNMTSDVVRGLRKRAGTRLALDISSSDSKQWSLGNTGHLRQYTANLGWGVTSFIVNTITGKLTSIVETDTVQLIGQSDYLITTNPADIVFTTVGSTLYIGNCDVYPKGVYSESRTNPNTQGYAFVLAGAYLKEFKITVSTSTGTMDASYTTPSAASGESASTYAAIEYIVDQLMEGLTAAIGGVTGLTKAERKGSYIYLECAASSAPLNVVTPSGTSYMVASNTHTVDATTKLPAQLPASADGFIMNVGDDSSWQYYQWDNANTRWKECGAYGSMTSIDASTMPIAVNSTDADNTHEITAQTWPGREAGDDDNNEVPEFLSSDGQGITGISSFQGRLILFSGPYISMASSNKEYRNNFFRTTVTEILDSDRIEFTSTSFSGATFRHGIPFNSDLILASDQHQGVIPGRSQVLTPNNATAVLTSSYQMDTDIAPLAAGRSLYYSYPRSNSSFAVKEMLPSGYTDLQYTSQDVTEHLPTYLEGAASFICASTTNNIVVFGSTTEPSKVYVNEYVWSGDQKAQSSWHEWDLTGTIHAGWFVREVLCLLVERDGNMRLLSLSLRDSPDITDTARYLPALDMCVAMTVTDPTSYAPTIQFPSSGLGYQLWQAVDAGYDAGNVCVVMATGDYIGAEVGIKAINHTTRTLTLQPSYGDSTVYVGLRFTSRFAPTPPRILDNNGNYVDVTKMIVQFYNLTLRYTTPFTINAYDRGGTVWGDSDIPAISYSSEELNLEQASVSARYHLKVRVGMEVETSMFELVSNSPGDLNIQGMGYIVKFNNRIRRL